MDATIVIARILYEEPYHLQLRIEVSNSRQSAFIDIYVDVESLKAFADLLESFPRHISDVALFELGSERPEDRFAYYVRIRAFIFNSLGRSALHIRFNNNRDLPYRELSEFCIECEAAAINRLGALLREFMTLKHEKLFWSLQEGYLD